MTTAVEEIADLLKLCFNPSYVKNALINPIIDLQLAQLFDDDPRRVTIRALASYL